jgi:uncharacterized membrane protein YphA (DoxX/SURF4 family)
MPTNAGISKPVLWTGRVMTALPALLIFMGGVMKVMKLPAVIEGFAQAGVPEHLIVPVGIIEIVCALVYAIPRTSVLGAILLTGLLGGATLTNWRVGAPATPMPVIVGMVAWGGLYLRDLRLRALIPLREQAEVRSSAVEPVRT